MKTPKIQFQFRKFEVSKELAIYANTMLLQVQEFAPQTFPTWASMTKVQSQYFCYLELSTGNETLAAESVSADPLAAIDKLHHRIRSKILNWWGRAVVEPDHGYFQETHPERRFRHG